MIDSDVPMEMDWPLMRNNISRGDLDALIALLGQTDPMLTQSDEVQAFEREWSAWLGVDYSVFVNSGSSANMITLAALKERSGLGEVIVPTLTWVSDIASVLQMGFTPVFADIDPRTLGMDSDQVIDKLTDDTKAVFLTHVLGYNALSQHLLDELSARNVPLIEDVCESYGATFKGQKLGTWGLASNFSFYYAHHLSTVEGGMVSTNDEELYEMLRMMRSHGLVREIRSSEIRQRHIEDAPDLDPKFIFAFPAYNVRSTEMNAAIGRSQLKRLDRQNQLRSENLDLFLDNLDPAKYRVDFDRTGSCNYALTLVIKDPNPDFRDRVVQALQQRNIEYRRGTAGGGNQLRQPYLRRLLPEGEYANYPEVEHVHFYGFYIGNYPELEREKIGQLCRLLNGID